nr:hypothetical protein [Tanacetum cinerariifolium]
MEDTMLELVKICQEKEFLCIHDDIDDLIESALNSKLLLINSNSQRLDKKEQEVKNVVEHPAEREKRDIQSFQNFRVVHKTPEHLLSMGYEHLSITHKTESNEVTEFNAKNLLPIPSECKVALEDKRECDVPIFKNSPVCDNHSDIFSDSKIDDDISVYDDDFEDDEYIEASLSDPEIVSIEEENVVQHEEEEVDFEDISQIQDIVLHEKLLSITRLISNIKSLNDNPTPDREGDIRFLEALLIDDSILSHESSNSNFEDNLSIPRPLPEPPDAQTDAGEETLVMMNDKDEDVYSYFIFVIFYKMFSLLSAESKDTIFDLAAMSSSTVTYISVYTDSESGRVYWGADEELSDEEYPEYLAPSEDEAPIEDQPLPTDASPTALSPCFVADSYPDEDPKEDPEEDHADYPADGGDGDDEPSDDDDDDDDDTDDKDEEPFKDEDDNEEEEHQLWPTLLLYQLLTLFPQLGARKTVRPEPPMLASIKASIAKHDAAPPPPLPISSLPLPLPSPLTTSPTDVGVLLDYKAAGIRMRALLLPTSPRTDVLEAEMPPRKRACFTTLALGLEIKESLVAALTTLEGVDQRVTELDNTIRQRTEEFQAGSEDKSAAIEAYVKTLEAQVATLIAHTSSLQTQLTTTLGRIETLEARDLEPQDEPAKAGSS